MNFICYILFLFILINSCESPFNKTKEEMDPQKLKESLIKTNKSAAEIESEQIDAYIKRQKWNVIKTGSGLRYMIYKEGNGEPAKMGQYAKIDFEITLLNGTVCYSNKGKKPAEFLIGQDNVESGLHEGITYMHVGARAKLVLPSHLAHGLIGDQDKIPPRSTIIYDIELLDVK